MSLHLPQHLNCVCIRVIARFSPAMGMHTLIRFLPVGDLCKFFFVIRINGRFPVAEKFAGCADFLDFVDGGIESVGLL